MSLFVRVLEHFQRIVASTKWFLCRMALRLKGFLVRRISRQTGEVSRQTGDVSCQIGEVSCQTGEISRQTVVVSCQTVEISRQTGEISRQPGKVSCQTGEVLKFPTTCTEAGLSKGQIEELITTKVGKIMDNSEVQTANKTKQSAIKSVIKYVYIRVNEGNDFLDQRFSSHRIYVKEGLLPNQFDSPKIVNENKPKKQGAIKPVKGVHHLYHDAQEDLFISNDMKSDGKGYLVHEDGRKMSTIEFCNAVDQRLTVPYVNYFRDISNKQYTNKRSTTLTKLREDLLEDASKVLNILQGRMYVESVIGNDILSNDGWKQWYEHVMVISSFGSLLSVLELIGIQEFGGSVLQNCQ